jgi:DNA modification methylase
MAEKMNNLTGSEWLKHSFSIWRDIRKTPEEMALKHPAMFPSQLCEKLIDIYTRESGEVILDPFSGTGSTLVAAANRDRQGIGIELNPEYAEIANQRIAQITTSHPTRILVGDARHKLTELEDESVDLCINSPPYWDILNQKRSVDDRDISAYSDSESDLGNTEDYEQFLDELKEVYSEVYRTLKPNKRCVCVVMDIRKKSQFFPLHMDLSRVMVEIGFEVEEFVIWDRQHEYNNMKPLGYPWVFRVNKVHEFVCIFWKR